MNAAELLAARGIEATVLRLLSVSHWDVEQIYDLMSAKPKVFVMEEVCGGSGIREALAMDLDANLTGVDLGHNFVTHGSMNSLYLKHELDAQSVCDRVLEVLRSES